MQKSIWVLLLVLTFLTCKNNTKSDVVIVEEKEISLQDSPFIWEGANLYFLLTDRFNNGDTSNDVNFNRTKETGKLRGF